jgi:outer membrane protein assembly factor BamB
MKYNAFISYRHGELDGLVAEKLHRMLETYRVPRAIAKKCGMKRISRVFRDRDELPTSSDLSLSITDALDNSDFLVLICSPRTLESQWVLREVEYFGDLRGKDRIITLLIDGEPEESFPPEISRRVIDGETVLVEPLAADIRAETRDKSVKLLKDEKLRVIAPILGCAYDDLKQRHRERRRKRIATVSGVTLALALAFGGLFSWQQSRIHEQTLRKLENESLALAGYAAAALAEGDSRAAVQFALDGLPKNTDDPERPHVAAAEKALADALGVYDLSDGYRLYAAPELPSVPFQIALSPDGKTAAAVYAYEVAAIDTDTAEIIAALPAAPSALAEAEFAGNNMLVYAGADGICAYDTAARKELWRGGPATGVAASADGGTIAAVFKDGDAAVIYDAADGREKANISFEGKKQRVAANDTFANPNDNLFALNADGSLLAVSFDDGSLRIFDLTGGENTTDILPPSDFFHFEGGFCGRYFAFSATDEGMSVFATVDVPTTQQTNGFQSARRFGVVADEGGVFISSDNIVVEIDPASGEQREAAYIETDVIGFARDASHTVVASDDGGYAVFDRDADGISKYGGSYLCDFVRIAGDFALTAGRDSPVLRILKRIDRAEAHIAAYDSAYAHDEARVNADGTRVMLFSVEGFRLYDPDGRLLREVSIPDAGLARDQQYSGKSGNLAVIYRDALRIYAGEDGALLFEETGLQSVFYAPYGVSVLKSDGAASLIDLDMAEALQTAETAGGFAAFCGLLVDEAFLAGRELLGAAERGEDYVFAVGDGTFGSVYGGDGEKLFDIAAPGDCEAFFTENLAVISPLHGVPALYSLETGQMLRELEKDAYLTYVTQTGDRIVTEYISTNDRTRFGILLNAESGEALARLPALAGLAGDALLFDHKKGSLRQSRIYRIDELIRIAKE